MPQGQTKSSKGPWLWPLALAAVGVVLLLHNYLLLGDFAITNLWPLLLVVAGVQILLRGDLAPGWHSRTFGITRGSVEAGTLEISAGEIDVGLRALRPGAQERLIAGQYAPLCRPVLQVNDVHTLLKMRRSDTPWLSFADWEMGLARDLPWQIYISTHLGQIDLDLSDVIVLEAVIASGIGDVRVVCPLEAFSPLYLRSTLGNVHLLTPPGYNVRVQVQGGRLFGLNVNPDRYDEIEPGLFASRDAGPERPEIPIYISGVFGEAYLA